MPGFCQATGNAFALLVACFSFFKCSCVKRIILIVFFILTGALFYANAMWTNVRLNQQAQGKRPAQSTRPSQVDYSRFKHSSHTGAVKASGKGTVQQLDCAYCHGKPATGNPDTLKGYPYRKYGLKNEMTHSVCSDCHAITGRDAVVAGSYPAMCLICHQKSRTVCFNRTCPIA